MMGFGMSGIVFSDKMLLLCFQADIFLLFDLHKFVGWNGGAEKNSPLLLGLLNIDLNVNDELSSIWEYDTQILITTELNSSMRLRLLSSLK